MESMFEHPPNKSPEHWPKCVLPISPSRLLPLLLLPLPLPRRLPFLERSSSSSSSSSSSLSPSQSAFIFVALSLASKSASFSRRKHNFRRRFHLGRERHSNSMSSLPLQPPPSLSCSLSLMGAFVVAPEVAQHRRTEAAAANWLIMVIIITSNFSLPFLLNRSLVRSFFLPHNREAFFLSSVDLFRLANNMSQSNNGF